MCENSRQRVIHISTAVAVIFLREQVANLNQVLRGHYAYYGIGGNFRAMQRVRRFAERYWYKMLCSRCRNGLFRWEVFYRIMALWPLERALLAMPSG